MRIVNKDGVEAICCKCGESWVVIETLVELITTEGCSDCWLKEAEEERKHDRVSIQ